MCNNNLTKPQISNIPDDIKSKFESMISDENIVNDPPLISPIFKWMKDNHNHFYLIKIEQKNDNANK